LKHFSPGALNAEEVVVKIFAFSAHPPTPTLRTFPKTTHNDEFKKR
jgi:hypothetical protein